MQLLDRTLNEDLVKRWAWDRAQEGGAHERVRPNREMRDLYDMVREQVAPIVL